MVKVATKGQQEIHEENKATITQYTIASAVASALYFLPCQLFWECNSTSYVFFGITVLVQLFAVLFMKRLAAAKFDSKDRVVDAGADLNDPEAFGEYCKDSIILTVLTQVLALYSNYFYLLLLAFPGFLGYKFIFGFFLPWVTAPAENEEVDEKKQRKMERRGQKVVYRR